MYTPIKNIMISMLFFAMCNIQAYASTPFQTAGSIELNNFQRNGYIWHTINSTIKLINGVEFIRLLEKDSQSNVLKYQLKLNAQQSNMITFESVYKQDGQSYPGSCSIYFTNIHHNRADFKVLDDSTLFKCGIDQNGGVAVNFS